MIKLSLSLNERHFFIVNAVFVIVIIGNGVVVNYRISLFPYVIVKTDVLHLKADIAFHVIIIIGILFKRLIILVCLKLNVVKTLWRLLVTADVAELAVEVRVAAQRARVNVDAIDALDLAVRAGSAKACNIVLMGRLAKYFDMPKEKWLAAIEKCVKPQFVEINRKAFELGYNC